MLAARVILVLVAVAIVVAGAAQAHDDHRCATASTRALTIGLGGSVPGGIRGVERDAQAGCRGGGSLANIAGALAHRDASLNAAARLATEAVRREPGDYDTWLAFATVLQRRGDIAAARRALARVHRLNPRY